MQALILITQLLFCLATGYIFAKKIPTAFIQFCFKVLPYFSYILLIAISMEFTHALQDMSGSSQILSSAITLALFTTLGAFFCCFALYKFIGLQPMSGKISLALLLKSFLSISYACLALAVGFLIAKTLEHHAVSFQVNTWYLLLVFMFLIGLDLAFSPLDRSWLNLKILLVPFGCIIGSIAGALLASLFLKHIQLKDIIMLSQGYGFYSMSGIVISELKSAELGSIALINDLFREIIAILLMYCIGWRYPRSAIASAAATAMDVSLPMVKQACGNDFIPHAMVSGFILSILAPIAVSILAAI
ncbi:LysO family transporter [Acinetobacter sp. GXMZU3951]|jgi:uncharacterized membrane protein YbjE (DUF340 family)